MGRGTRATHILKTVPASCMLSKQPYYSGQCCLTPEVPPEHSLSILCRKRAGCFWHPHEQSHINEILLYVKRLKPQDTGQHCGTWDHRLRPRKKRPDSKGHILWSFICLTVSEWPNHRQDSSMCVREMCVDRGKNDLAKGHRTEKDRHPTPVSSRQWWL